MSENIKKAGYILGGTLGLSLTFGAVAKMTVPDMSLMECTEFAGKSIAATLLVGGLAGGTTYLFAKATKAYKPEALACIMGTMAGVTAGIPYAALKLECRALKQDAQIQDTKTLVLPTAHWTVPAV